MSQFQTQSTGMPGGFANAAQWQTMGEAGTPDPTWSQMFEDDFVQYVASSYVLNGAGTPAAALAAGIGGLLNLVTTAANLDTTNLQLPVACYQATPGKNLFFKALIKGVATASSDIYAGLFPVSATAIDANDFLGFVCLTGQTNWIFRSRIGGVNTDTALPANFVHTDGTSEELGFFIDRQGNIAIFYNPTTGNNPISAAAAASNQPRGRVAALLNTTTFSNSLTQVALSPTVGIRSNSTAAKTLQIDFLVCSAER